MLRKTRWSDTHLSKDLIKGLQDKLHEAPLGAAGWGLFCELPPKEKRRVLSDQGGRKPVLLTPKMHSLNSESGQEPRGGLCVIIVSKQIPERKHGYDLPAYLN
jgi:hypothetical protein